MAAGLTIAIIGRPNVGKSTLFNRLAGKRLALVHDRPGVTRDFRTAPARLGRLDFTIIDTPGLEEDRSDSLAAGMRRQAERALEQADLALFMIDARAGITPLDEHFAAWLRRSGRPVIVVANKVESRAGEPGVLEAHGLGLGDPVACSAEHGIGLGDLEDAVLEALQAAGIELEATDAAEQEEPFADIELEEGAEEAGEAGPPRLIRLAVVGRPNVGKSTLINALLGEERLLTGPTPGVTRDAIPIDWEWEGQPIRLVDTAGLRKKARVEDVLEKMSGGETMRAVRLAQVVVLVLDGEAILDRQDLTIAAHVVEEGRALVIAVNKWDAVPDRQAALQRLNDRLQTSLTQIRNVPTVTISALEGRNLGKLLDTVLATYRRWDTRVGTGPLNRWLGGALDAHAPPMVGGRRLKIRYMTQVKARPPSFALWCNRPEMMPAAYKRYLINGLREAFDLEGVPIRLLFRKGENPYT